MKSFCSFLLVLLLPAFLQAQFSDALLGKKPIRNSIWLQKVSIGNWNFTSGVNDGYYLVEDSKLTLRPDSTYALQLELGGYPRVQDTAYLRVWIDLNRDKDFEDAGEQVWEGKTLHRAIARGEFKMPEVESGNYVLRVLASKKAYSTPTGEQAMVIEMEDYHFRIERLAPCRFDQEKYVQIIHSDYTSATVVLKNNNQIRYDFLLTITNPFETIDFRKTYQDVQVDTLRIEGLRERFDYVLATTLSCPNGDTMKPEPLRLRAAFSVASNCDNKKTKRVWLSQFVNNALLAFVASPDNSRLQGRYRKKEEAQWSVKIKEGTYRVVFDSLEDHQEYVFQVRLFCPEGQDWGDWSEEGVFKIENCRPPSAYSIELETEVLNHPIMVATAEMTGGLGTKATYQWSYRELGSLTWMNVPLPAGFVQYFRNLKAETTYELQLQISCANGNAITKVDTFTVPPACDVIRQQDVKLSEISDTEVRISMRTGYKVGFEFRYRADGGSSYTYVKYPVSSFVGINPIVYFRQLSRSTRYELSARMICGNDTLAYLAWSAPVFFTTKACISPEAAEITMVEMNANQSMVLSTDLIKHSGISTYNYNWKYRAVGMVQWNTLSVKGNNQITLNKLTLNQTYEIQAVVKCLQDPLDSLTMSSKFIFNPEQCGQKPSSSFVKYQELNDGIVWISYKLPNNYKAQMRTRWYAVPSRYVEFTPANSDVYYSSVGPVFEFQFRLICPNNNISPWSDTLRLKMLQPFQGGANLALVDPKKPYQGAEITISPNPSSGQLSILFPAEMEPQPEAYLEVLNTAGQRIWAIKTAIDPAQTLPIDLSKQTPGLYILRIQAGQKVYTERIMIASNR